jgi:SAM-dependent methyltransferase
MLIHGNSGFLALKSNTIHCVAGSPPYFAKRDYNLPPTFWPSLSYLPQADLEHKITIPEMVCQLGNEPTMLAYVGHLVFIAREIKRVLRPDGVFWLNLGDGYISSSKGSIVNKNSTLTGSTTYEGISTPPRLPDKTKTTNLKPKNLALIPNRVLLALQADGWYVRNEVVWQKPNCLPSSAHDRLTVDHEMIYFLTKSSDYFFDHEAIREPSKEASKARAERRESLIAREGMGAQGKQQTSLENGDGYSHGYAGIADGRSGGGTGDKRNKRTVWKISVAGFHGDHYAVWPEKLVLPMILAGCSPHCCSECGKPWKRQISKSVSFHSGSGKAGNQPGGKYDGSAQAESGSYYIRMGPVTRTRTLGWRPGCTCGLPPRRYKEDDFEVILSPQGENEEERPGEQSLLTGRAGMNRERQKNEGLRPITRYEQRQYAKQLKKSPEIEKMRIMAGEQAFAHYLRTDRTGARPIPPSLLDTWLGWGWLQKVEVPEWTPPPPVPGIVLDTWCGSGTTGLVARKLGRRFVGIDLNPEYLGKHALPRAEKKTIQSSIEQLPLFQQGDQ